LRHLVTKVVKSFVPEPKAQQPAKKNKKVVDSATTGSSGPILQVILHDTIIFPEGGGQPSDIGFIATSAEDLWEVTEVKRVGGHAIHFVRLLPGMGLEVALKVFSPGAEVTVSLGEEGLKRRLDHVCVSYILHALSSC
jgi:misacylated tRNA(Ala) deacylase